MKKLFTLIIVALAGFMGATAQTVTVNKTDGTSVTYKASDVKDIVFAPADEKPDTTVFKELTGYLTCTFQSFTDVYYGDQAKMTVLTVGKQFLCRFEDPTWGKGLFSIEMSGGSISGSGKITMADPNGGTSMEYEATMSGTMTAINISVPGVMGGTTISWHHGTPSAALKASGSYTGTNKLAVGAVATYTCDTASAYTITANSDNSINLTVCEESYKNTVMGDLTLSSYTIRNIAWSDADQAFVRSYGKDGIQFHFTAVKGGATVMDKDYTFDKDNCKVFVKVSDKGGLTVDNTFQMGAMPLEIKGSYTGQKK